jgi:flagellar biosynthesis protein FlhF
MQIKKFRALDMTEALRLVKKEFGCQAVILSAKEMKNGAGVLGFLKGPCVEVTAATDSGYSGDTTKNRSVGKRRLHKGAPVGPVSIDRRDWRRPFSLLKEEAGALGNRANPVQVKNHQSQRGDVEMSLFDLSQKMQNQGVKEKIALDLIKELDAAISSNKLFRHENFRPNLIGSLRKMGVATKSMKIARGKHEIIALVGPTGVGKTTTIAKLAAIGTFAEKRTVGLITLDDKRIGAIAQLQAYAGILGVQMEVASSKEEFKESLKKLKRKDIILVDTPGISLKNTRQLNELKNLFDSVGSVSIHLLVSAVTKEKDFIRILGKFRVMPIDSLIYTKLDESGEYGDLLNQLIRTKIPVSYLTNGPQVPEDMEVATVEGLVDLILGGKEKRGDRSLKLGKPENDGPVQYEYGPYLKQSYA